MPRTWQDNYEPNQHTESKDHLRWITTSLVFPFSGVTLIFIFLQALFWKLRRADNGKSHLHPTAMVVMYSLTTAMWLACAIFAWIAIIPPLDTDAGGNTDGFAKWEGSMLCDSFMV